MMQDFDPANSAGTQKDLKFLEWKDAKGRPGERSASFFQDLEALAGLPFLIGKPAAGSVDEAVIVCGGLGLLVQRVIGGRPKEEG